MADGDFTYIQDDLAALVSLKSASLLSANELAQLKALINEAYRECYIRPSGKRVRWGEEYISFLLPAPVTFTFAATQNSAAIASVVGVTLNASYAGSKVKIGSDWYTLASATALLEPYTGPTGTVSATIYYSSYVLPTENIDVSEEPEVVGWGRLAPFAGRTQEIRNRSWGTGDFIPESGALAQSSRFAGLRTDEQTGDPLFYYIDSASLVGPGAVTSVQNRFNVYPLPDGATARRIRIRGNYVPAAMTSGAALPLLPASATIDTLLPIARAKFVSVQRRFNGTNRAEIIAQGQLAQAKLDTLANAQKKKPSRLRLADGR